MFHRKALSEFDLEMLLLETSACMCAAAASPRSRLQYLLKPPTPWSSVLVYEVGQQGAMNGPYECSSSSNNSSGGSSSGDQLQEAMKLPLMGYSHLVYVCYKTPLH